MKSFFQFSLRTSDVDAARAFYTTLLGECTHPMATLHAQAVARGARPHWLGLLDVGDVDPAAAAFSARGAQVLARWTAPDGLEAAVMRDPGGAIVALAKPPAREATASSARPEIVWHMLHTPEVERAQANYGELVGWEFKEPAGQGEHGVHTPFSWERGGAPVGAMADIGGRSHIHPHWMFFFPVADLGSAMEAVRAGGGVVVGPLTLPDGAQIAACDDPQGAAFGIWQSR